MAGPEDGQKERRKMTWRWVGADPDDTSPDADFRRQVATLAREVLLARGVDEDSVPPRARGTRAGATKDASQPDGAGGSASPSQTPESISSALSFASDPFEVRATAPFLLEAAARAIRTAVRRDFGVSRGATVDSVLLAVASRGRTTTADLTRTLFLRASTLSTALTQLEDRGLVVRSVHPGDRRRRVVELTAEGDVMAERLAARWLHVDDRLLDGLTIGERDELCRLLRRVVSALSAHRGCVRRGSADI